MSGSKRVSVRAWRTSVLALAAVSFTAASLATTEARAQALVRRITGGPISGLELSIEGPRRVARGGRVQWQLAVHEVTGLSTLRAAPGARVRVLASFSRDRAMADVTADALGRTQAGFDVPEDAPSTFHVVFEAISRNNIRRQFDLDVAVTPGRSLELFTDRASVRPGGTLHAWGRLVSVANGRPIANAPIVLTMTDQRGRPVGARRELTTDARGGFSQPFTLPRAELGSYSLRAQHRSEHESLDANQTVSAHLVSAPALVVRAMPEQSMSAPRGTVQIFVSVRTADGRPVPNAIVHSSRMPRDPRAAEAPSVRTDERGIAVFRFNAPEVGSAMPLDLPVDVSASRVGLGDASARTIVRIAREGLFGAASIEGRALVEGLAGRVFARVVRPDGNPVGAGVTVNLTGPRFGRGARAVTDADGVAALDVTLGPVPAARPVRRPARPAGEDGEGAEPEEPQDSCGGTLATSFTLAFEQGAVRGTLSSCAPIEPDGMLRVRVREGALVQPGAEIHATIQRLPSVARAPLHVVLLSSQADGFIPVAGAIAAAGANEVALRVPEGVTGLLVVRARPLFGPLGEPVLGGSTAVWSHAGQRAALSITQASGTALTLDPGQATGLGAMVSVVPSEQAEHLLQRLRAHDGRSGLGDLRVEFARAGDALLLGAVSALVPRDVSVQAVLRGGRMVELPAPTDPAAWGTLRDPFRASARFVEGRLALIFQRIENHVASMVRARRADVGQRNGARWEFNREIFEAILRSSDGDSSGGARNLGGAPMTIDDLRRLDAAFTFDNVARRITRRRMFALLVALRQFVNQHSLDLRWSWRGDPTVWLRRMASDGDVELEDSDGNTTSLGADEMVDGWGNSFVLRASASGRSRFGFLSPVGGYDLVSAGPDERIGTADDVVDPFARVLPSGGAYARAVDEDGLIARLRGVELGRATIARLGGLFESDIEMDYADVQESGGEDDSGAGPNWGALPSRFVSDPFALAILRPARFAPSVLRGSIALSGATEVPTGVDDEPRTWTAIAHGFAADGTSAFTSRAFVAGTPVLVTLPIAPRNEDLRPQLPRVMAGEPLEVVATVTNLDATDRRFTITVTGEGSVRVTALSALEVSAGRSAELPLRIEAQSAGPGIVRVDVRDPSGAVLRSTRAPVLADLGGLSLREDVMGVSSRGAALSLRGGAPADARATLSRLVISAPSGLADDPELDRVRRTDPALIAWAYTLSGRAVPTALADQLFAAQGPGGEVSGERRGRSVYASDLLSTAAALVVWAGSDEDDAQGQRALAMARARLSSLRTSMDDSDPVAGRVRADAAALTALATGAPGPLESEGTDPVAAFVANARESMRPLLESHAAQPTVLARAAAALLITDPTDARGRTLYERAKLAIVDEGARGALVGAGEGRVRLEEVLAATAAMAIAAQQRGDLALAQRLARGVAVRGHLAMRAGGEVAFWLLADAAFGVFGLEAPTRARVTINNAPREIAMTDGHAVIDLADERSASVEILGLGDNAREGSLFARWECRYDRAATARADGPVSLAVQGDVGYAGERAALELTVTGTATTATPRVVVELQLPAGAMLDPAVVAQLGALPTMASAELRDGGLLRLVLRSITKDQIVTIPLALRWMAQGTLTGLGAVAYAESRPTLWTVLPSRELALRARPAAEALTVVRR